MCSFPSLYSKVLRSSTAIALTAFFALPSYAMDDDRSQEAFNSYVPVSFKMLSYAEQLKDVPNGKVTTVISNSDAIGSYLIESQPYDVVPNQALSIEYDITVDGDIAFGFLNQTRNGWYPILNTNTPLVMLGSGSHKHKTTMIAPPDAVSTSLVFVHNKYDLGTSTTFTINNLKVNEADDPKFSQLFAKKVEFGTSKAFMTNNDVVGSYQLETTPFIVKGGQKIRATFELGLDGKLAFGFLNQSRNGWYDQVFFVAGNDMDQLKKHVVDVTVPNGEKQASFVFAHNEQEYGVGSLFTLSDWKIEIEEDNIPDVKKIKTCPTLDQQDVLDILYDADPTIESDGATWTCLNINQVGVVLNGIKEIIVINEGGPQEINEKHARLKDFRKLPGWSADFEKGKYIAIYTIKGINIPLYFIGTPK